MCCIPSPWFVLIFGIGFYLSRPFDGATICWQVESLPSATPSVAQGAQKKSRGRLPAEKGKL
jgi:hypothetical protein